MTELVNEKLGDKANVKVEFKEGKLVAELVYDHPVVDAGIVLKLDSEAVIEALKKAIPGTIDDVVLEAAKALLKK